MNADDNELDILRRDRDLLREELFRTRAERDRLRIELMHAELAGHSVTDFEDGDQVEVQTLRAEAARLAAEVAEVRRELAAHLATVSWRVTSGLRVVRRWQLRR